MIRFRCLPRMIGVGVSFKVLWCKWKAYCEVESCRVRRLRRVYDSKMQAMEKKRKRRWRHQL